MGVLTLLGTALIVALRGGLATWRRSEARRTSYETAQAVLGQLRDDLEALVAPDDAPPGETTRVEARLLCDTDDAGRQRLFLVRTITAESEHPITGLAGSTVLGDRVIDSRDDLAEARASRLRATGGAQEVAWVLGADGVLYRGYRAPIGSPGSLFDAQGAWALAPTPVARPGAPAPEGALGLALGGPEAGGDEDDGPPGPALLRPFAAEVLWVELRFWTQFTTTWRSGPCLRNPTDREESGPLDYWDSTRALLRPADPHPRHVHLFRGPASLQDPRDDVLPQKVYVALTVRERPEAGTSTFLARPLGATDREVWLEDTSRCPPYGGHVLVDQEWIRYERVDGDALVVAPDGRGARGTEPAEHQGEVVVGRTFELVVAVPAYREDWSDRWWEAR